MTAADLIRHNLARLVRESGHDVSRIAVRAWPIGDDRPADMWHRDVDTRRQKLARYLDGSVRPSFEALDDLARALGCTRAEFLREPIQTPSPITETP